MSSNKHSVTFWSRFPILSRPTVPLTFRSALPQLSVLDESSKHLRLHEDSQEAADAFGGYGLAEGFTLEHALASLALSQEERIVSNGLQEKADEGLGHHAVQRVTLWGEEKEDSPSCTTAHRNDIMITNPFQLEINYVFELKQQYVIFGIGMCYFKQLN